MVPRFGPTVALQRLRIRLLRLGPAAQLSQLQQIDAVRKALLASAWPVAKAQGKRPKLKLSFGPAISVGYESEAEYVDLEMESRLDLNEAKGKLNPPWPEGYALLNVRSIPRFFPSLEESLNLAAYQIVSPLLQDTRDQWERFWAESHFPVTKKKADGNVVVDARLCVKEWKLEQNNLMLTLRFGPGRTLKPEKIIQAVCGLSDEQVIMGGESSLLRVKRLQLYFEKANGELVEP
jgi:radical SAM-linked protein